MFGVWRKREKGADHRDVHATQKVLFRESKLELSPPYGSNKSYLNANNQSHGLLCCFGQCNYLNWRCRKDEALVLVLVVMLGLGVLAFTLEFFKAEFLAFCFKPPATKRCGGKRIVSKGRTNTCLCVL